MKVYEAIAQAFVDEEPGALFTLIGNANMEFVAAMCERGGPTPVHGRIEATVVGMTEGYARSTGKLGVGTVTLGPSFTNATTTLTSAVRAQTPMVLFTGHGLDRNDHAFFDQEALARLTGAAYFDIRSSGYCLEVVRQAFREARTERRPVVLDAAKEIQHSDFAWSYSYEPSFKDVVEPVPLTPDQQAIQEAVGIIGASERPVFLIGRGALDLADEVKSLASDVGGLLATSLYAKNRFESDPYNLGVAGLFSTRFATELFAEADCVVAVGASLNHYTIEGGYLFPNAKVVHIERLPNVLMGSGQRADCYVQADAALALDSLSRAVKEQGIAGQRFRTDAIREKIVNGFATIDVAEFEIEEDRADPRKILDIIDQHFPRESAVVVGTGHSWGFSNIHLRKFRSPQLYSNAFGSIGIALPLSLGTAVGNPERPVLHVEGDGSVMMNLHNFDTMAQYNLPVFVVVMNDAAFGSETHKMTAKGLDPTVTYLREVDFASVASAVGCRSAVVRTDAEMKAAIDEFAAAPGPYVVDLRASQRVVSVPFRRVHFGMEA